MASGTYQMNTESAKALSIQMNKAMDTYELGIQMMNKALTTLASEWTGKFAESFINNMTPFLKKAQSDCVQARAWKQQLDKQVAEQEELSNRAVAN
ncbi:hypothetical protein DMH04_26930 [Kibdelosporangium aridum]|uniref:Uncharacterized protein n=1 Tax=Kibdelosporangium aridum TaxID=2030 RepID=A0A428Z576_KIBAR|nr:hypothetical protein [Kibdelosporangium aridum]RSM81979.1 hypothetical protein DMH04_26930 [Kibdelosporangium aridum]